MEFKLRKWKLDDVNSLVKYANNKKIAANLTDQFPHPYTLDNGKAFIEMASKGNPISIFAIEINGEAVGGIGLHPQTDIHKKNAELGYWLAEPYWGKGIVSNAVKEIVTYGFENFDIDRIFARPFGTNIGSQKVLEKAGFILEGTFKNTLYKNGVYLDELIYAVRKNN
jgi:RimJ/RimL family protein N-acetyltransferase